MANWYGASRSNYFKVKDADAFLADMARIPGLDVTNDERGFMVSGDEEGYWPSYRTSSGDAEYDEDIWLPDVIAEHLADGSIAVFQTAGAEKLRYLTGYAVAVDNKGGLVEVNIADIYGLAAAELGAEPSRAEY